MNAFIVVSADGEQHALDRAAVDRYRSALRGSSLTPGEPGYDDARRVWNGYVDKRPAIIAQCAGVDDVIRTVNFAREHDILLAIRGGGHNVAGTALCDGGITLDLSRLRAVRVDPEARIAEVDPGATIGDMDRETQAFGLAAASGLVSETGIAGLTLGGGTGWLRGKYGLASDNLVSADIVTADGNLLYASEDENADLLWALRGGGGNFGVVTCFRLRLHRVGPELFFAAPMYPIERAADVVPRWRDFCVANSDDENIASYCMFITIPEGDAFPEHLWGREVVALPTAYIDTPQRGEAALAPLRHLGAPVLDNSGTISWCELQSAFDWVFPAGLRYYWKTNSVGALGGEAIDAIIDVGRTRSSPRTGVAIWQSGAAMSRVAESATGFGPRAPWGINIDAAWSDPADDDSHVGWTRAAWSRLRQYAGDGQYVNYAALESEDQLRTAFGANFERLREIKCKYDPGNLFRVNQNIRPAGAKRNTASR
jgi:FAD/FMN-containing dehydrogenase